MRSLVPSSARAGGWPSWSQQCAVAALPATRSAFRPLKRQSLPLAIGNGLQELCWAPIQTSERRLDTEQTGGRRRALAFGPVESSASKRRGLGILSSGRVRSGHVVPPGRPPASAAPLISLRSARGRSPLHARRRMKNDRTYVLRLRLVTVPAVIGERCCCAVAISLDDRSAFGATLPPDEMPARPDTQAASLGNVHVCSSSLQLHAVGL